MVKDQKTMWDKLCGALDPDGFDMRNSFNGRLEPHPVGCSLEEMTSEIEYPILEWELNQAGQVHGGILCTMFDISAGSLAKIVNELEFNPTVSLNVRFIRPAMHGDTAVIKTVIESNGRTLVNMSGRAFSKNSGKLLATAAVTFINTDNRRNQ
ncbi:MAG: PaaI family thioesterase [Eubacteriaceae bacterium]|jgi:uncharacterized protein (TIGR00369 family)|nr:PaaI family thioesterase [Eubacteriaceae bacterium]